MTGVVDRPRLVQAGIRTRRDDAPRRVAVIGSTGSIGTQTLDVIRSSPDRFAVSALGAARSVELLAAQAAEFHPDVVALADETLAQRLIELLPAGIELRAGPEALGSLVETAEVVLNAVVGFAGLGVTVAALSQGRRLALANKESLVAGAPVVQRARQVDGAELLPVDSEHGAIFQCLSCGRPEAVSKLVLTASGGPFRGRTAAELASVTVTDALAHPTWRMGPKITVDSSTLMNKGLEVIEARELFGVDYDRIEVVVHPQSVVHSMVEFCDGTTIAQLSVPDMRLPIGFALGYPDRLSYPYGSIDFGAIGRLEFEPPDLATFPCLRLAYEAGRAGGSAPAWLNAANELAVAAFLDGRLTWPAIAEVVAETLQAHEPTELLQVDDVLAADALARVRAEKVLEARRRGA
ncbi:MAG: 1-deoxy-D-xylulose-5-phosphate reductoisomerase [Acidimicrobiales bacterium]|jgi:1-deoxy-D-xylulose-5-phosphate reductoisomerase